MPHPPWVAAHLPRWRLPALLATPAAARTGLARIAPLGPPCATLGPAPRLDAATGRGHVRTLAGACPTISHADRLLPCSGRPPGSGAAMIRCALLVWRLPPTKQVRLSGVSVLGYCYRSLPGQGHQSLGGEPLADSLSSCSPRHGKSGHAASGVLRSPLCYADAYRELWFFERAREQALAAKPTELPFEEAAIPQVGVIALQGIRREGCVQAGQKVLVNGVGGGAGMFAAQSARLAGAQVTGTEPLPVPASATEASAWREPSANTPATSSGRSAELTTPTASSSHGSWPSCPNATASGAETRVPSRGCGEPCADPLTGRGRRQCTLQPSDAHCAIGTCAHADAEATELQRP